MSVSVLGTGAIGSAVAQVLLGMDRDVHVWNRSPQRAGPLVDRGAHLAPSAAAAVAASSLTLVCLTDHEAVRSVIDALPGRAPGEDATLVLLTNGAPQEVDRSVSLAHARGLACLGAGVQTAPADVGTPRALFLYAGDEARFEQHRGELELLGPSRWLGPEAAAAAELDLALFGLWYDAQLALLRAFEVTGRAGVPPSELVEFAVTQLRHVVEGVEATAQEVTTGDYPRGPASLAEHLPVLARLRESRRTARLGDGGLGHVSRIVEELSSGSGAERGLTAVLDRSS